MANYNGFNFTTFSGVNVKNTLGLRFGPTGSDVAGTLSVPSDDEGSRAWTFPAKSGTFPIMGTFRVQFPTITSSSNTFSTVVTVAGIRAEDAMVVQLNQGVSAGYSVVGMGSGATARVLNSVTPGNGSVTLGFINMGATTGYADLIYSYLAVR